MLSKNELRKKYLALRDALAVEEINQKSKQIAQKIWQLPVIDKTYFHLYLSIIERKEVETKFILDLLTKENKTVVVSQSNFKTLEMKHFLLTNSTEIYKNKFNIPEPVSGLEIETKKIEVVFVPLLAYDLFGNRVGYGKGFYDRFLLECAPKTIKIGLSFFEPEQQIEQLFGSDIKLDFCISPFEIYRF